MQVVTIKIEYIYIGILLQTIQSSVKVLGLQTEIVCIQCCKSVLFLVKNI